MNSNLAIFNLGGGEVIVVLAVVLILFGAKKIPELAKGMGQGIKNFKQGLKEADELDAPKKVEQLPAAGSSAKEDGSAKA